MTAIDSTFAIIERVLDEWTLDSLDEVLSRPEWTARGVNARRADPANAHDVWHCADVNDTLSRHGLPLIDIWE